MGALAAGVLLPEPGSVVPAFDYHCPLMSLPLAFGTALETIPATVPYLSVPEKRRTEWRERLAQYATPRIGLAWSGRPTHVNDHNRSIPLVALAPLFGGDARFVSLQREYRDSDLADLESLPIIRFDDAIVDFADTAAIVDELDLVITVDTAVAHLAGALGKPVWIMLPRVPDWRWLLERDDSPWYPTARLFRQPRVGDWSSVIARVAATLSETIS